MIGLSQAIDQFEESFARPIQVWSAMVGEEDLDNLIQTLGRLAAASAEIGARFGATDRSLFERRWLPLLDRIRCQIPAILTHLERLRAEARVSLAQVQQAQQGLKGYRQSLPDQQTSFESEG